MIYINREENCGDLDISYKKKWKYFVFIDSIYQLKRYTIVTVP